MAGGASQAGDADSRAPGLTSGLQGSVNVHRGALLCHSDSASVLLYFTIHLKRGVKIVRCKDIPSDFVS